MKRLPGCIDEEHVGDCPHFHNCQAFGNCSNSEIQGRETAAQEGDEGRNRTMDLIQLGCTQDATTTCDSPPDLARYLANLAPATYRAYAGHLRRYAVSGRPLDRTNVVEWIASLARAGLSRKTVQQALAAVKLAVREAHYAGQVDAVTADAIRTIDVGWAGRERGEKVGRWLEVAQVRELFSTIDRRTHG